MEETIEERIARLEAQVILLSHAVHSVAGGSILYVDEPGWQEINQARIKLG